MNSSVRFALAANKFANQCAYAVENPRHHLFNLATSAMRTEKTKGLVP